MRATRYTRTLNTLCNYQSHKHSTQSFFSSTKLLSIHGYRNIHLTSSMPSVFGEIPCPEYRYVKSYSDYDNFHHMGIATNEYEGDAILSFDQSLALQRMEWRQILRNLYNMEHPEVAHFNTTLHALNRARRPVHANAVLEFMQRKDVQPDIVTIEQAFIVLSGGRYPQPIQRLFAAAEEQGLESSWLVDQYIRCICRHHTAYDEVQRLESKGYEIDPDVLSKVVLFAKELHPERLVSFYRKHRHLPLSADAFHTILSVTSQLGDTFLARYIIRDIQRASTAEGRTISPDVWVAFLVTLSHGHPPPAAEEFNHFRSLIAAKVEGDLELQTKAEEGDGEGEEDENGEDREDIEDSTLSTTTNTSTASSSSSSSSSAEDNQRTRRYRTAVLRGLYRTGQRRAFADTVAALPQSSYYSNQVLSIYAEGKEWDRFDARLEKMQSGELPPPNLGTLRIAVETMTERGRAREALDFWWQHVFPETTTQHQPRRVLEVGLKAALEVPEEEDREHLCLEIIEALDQVASVWVSPAMLETMARTPGCGGKDGKLVQLLTQLGSRASHDGGNSMKKAEDDRNAEEQDKE